MNNLAKQTGMKMTMEEAFFWGFFILLSLAKGLGFYEGQKLFLLLVVPGLLCGLLKILASSYTGKQLSVLTILFSMTALVYCRSRAVGILFVAFLVLGMKGISVKKVFHVGLWVWAVCSVFLSIFSFFRLEHTIYRVHAKMGLGHIFRWSLGFTHPNILHITYLTLCALILYEMGERYRLRHYILLMAGNLLVFLYSVSYTGFGIVAVLLTGCLYVQIRPRFCILEKALANLVLPVCLVLSFVLPKLLYDNPICDRVQALNALLNTRIWLADQFLVPEYRSLFGMDISQVVKSSMTMDNSYVMGYINYGLIPIAIIITGYFALLFHLTHRQKTRELVILVCFLAAGWTEQLLFNTSFKNITLVFLGALLFQQKDEEKEYCILPVFQREIWIPFTGLPDLLFTCAGAVWKAHRKGIMTAVLAGCVAGGLLCAVFYKEPDGYVVQRFYTDGLEETSVYLEREDDPAYAGYRVMNYKDAQTPMQVITGKAVGLETVRYYLGSILIGAAAGALIGVSGMGCRERKRTAISETP